MDYEDILYKETNGVATITINRPEKLNVSCNAALLWQHRCALPPERTWMLDPSELRVLSEIADEWR